MAERSRELSQFGAFLLVDNTSGNIAITTQTTPYVGIGTTNPQRKLHVIGDTIINGGISASGIVTAQGFYLEGIGELVDATVDRWKSASGSNIYRMDGNVGVGTSTITSKFEVLGGVRITGILTAIGNIVSNSVISASRFISTVSNGTAPFTVTSNTQVNNLNVQYLGGKGAPSSGNIVGTDSTDTLKNKKLEDSTTIFYDQNEPTREFRFEASGISNSTTRVLTIPDISGTIVVAGAPNVITSDMIVDLEIDNADIAIGASISYSKLQLTNSIVSSDIVNSTIENSKLQNNTISGVSLGGDLSNLTFGDYLSVGSYNGSTPVIVSVAATSANDSGDTIVSRDASGNFTATDITANSFIINGGSSSSFLKGDGSLDSNNYASIGNVIAMTIVFG
jgi:hypothetical protein